MKILVTGVSGYVGAAVAPRLVKEGHSVRGFARDRNRVTVDIPVIEGDAVTGSGLARALDGMDVAYFLIHSMEPTTDGAFPGRELTAASRFAEAAGQAGVRRIVYLGGILPDNGPRSVHLASRLAVEEALLESVPDSVALRASIVIGAGSRSFRFLVHLVERLPMLAVPAWNSNRTQPIDERDMIEMLVRSATVKEAGGRSLDVGGPDIVSYRQLIDRIRDLMLVSRPTVCFSRLTVTPIASRIAAVIAGEEYELVGPLMESLGSDLLLRNDDAAHLLGVRLHRLDAAIEHALRIWERDESLAAR